MTQYGMDFLGGARYQKTVLAEHPRAYGFGVFADVDGFGKAYALIVQVAKLGVPFIRVQLMWKDDHKFTDKDISEVRKRAAHIAPIVRGYRDIMWYVSPCCEHELNKQQWEKFADACLESLPLDTGIVNSPNHGKGFVHPLFINEYHGAEKKPRVGGRYAFSFDGTNCVDSDFEAYRSAYSDAAYFMLWNSQCNGRRNLADKTPRPQRKYWPTDKQIDSWVWLANRERGPVSIPKGWLYKSLSDQHTVPPSGKDQKPVWIIPKKTKEVVLKAANGQVIDSARYFGTFEGGGYRYYHTQWGFELAQKAIRIQGHAMCYVFVDNKKVGTINPAFRFGGFR